MFGFDFIVLKTFCCVEFNVPFNVPFISSLLLIDNLKEYKAKGHNNACNINCKSIRVINKELIINDSEE